MLRTSKSRRPRSAAGQNEPPGSGCPSPIADILTTPCPWMRSTAGLAGFLETDADGPAFGGCCSPVPVVSTAL
jgi:hypothetical protein